MYDFLYPFIVGAIIQSTKLFIDYFTLRDMKRHHIFTAGGFPSVHAGLTASVATLVFIRQGPDSTLFAVTTTLLLLFTYDAMNIRYEAGRHARYINHIKFELRNILWSNGEESGPKLKERMGHTRWEVLGGIIIGSVLTILLVNYLPLWLD